MIMFSYLVIFIALTVTALGTPSCDEGWNLYAIEQTCMKKVTFNQPFADARNTCMSYGGDLVMVNQDVKNTFVTGLVGSTRVWIGVWREEHDSCWTTVDRETLEYNNWINGSTNNNNKNKACASSGEGQWNVSECQHKIHSVCEKRAENPDCPRGWVLYDQDKTCLRRHFTGKEFHDARRKCQTEGRDGDLIIINDPTKNAFARKFLSAHNDAWIGTWDPERTLDWVSVDGSQQRYFNWVNKRHTGTKGNCVIMRGGVKERGFWEDVPCNNGYAFLCQIPAKSAQQPYDTTTTTASTTTPITTATTTNAPSPTATTTNTPTTTTTISNAPSTTTTTTTQNVVDWVHSKQDGMFIGAVNDRRATFDGARRFCQDKGGDLVTMLHNQRQNEFVKGLLRMRVFYWVGIRRPDKTAAFRFIDGQALGKFKPYSKKEPNNKGGKENCIEMMNGKWFDKRCKKKRFFVCQKHLD